MPGTRIAAIAEKADQLLEEIKALAETSHDASASKPILRRGLSIRQQVNEIVLLSVSQKTEVQA